MKKEDLHLMEKLRDALNQAIRSPDEMQKIIGNFNETNFLRAMEMISKAFPPDFESEQELRGLRASLAQVDNVDDLFLQLTAAKAEISRLRLKIKELDSRCKWLKVTIIKDHELDLPSVFTDLCSLVEQIDRTYRNYWNHRRTTYVTPDEWKKVCEETLNIALHKDGIQLQISDMQLHPHAKTKADSQKSTACA